MAVASRILGDNVGSTAPVFLVFLAVHVIAGLTAVATGAIAALSRKGSDRHIRTGRWFFTAIAVVFATAIVLAVMRWRQDYYLVLIGSVAFGSATIGYLHRRRHRPGDTGHILGMGIGYVAMLTAFYVDNGPHLPLLEHLPRIAFWVGPSAIGAPIIVRAIVRARRARYVTHPPQLHNPRSPEQDRPNRQDNQQHRGASRRPVVRDQTPDARGQQT